MAIADAARQPSSSELVAICGDDAACSTGAARRVFNRARVPAPFPGRTAGPSHIPARRRPADHGRAGLGGRQARQPPPRPGRARAPAATGLTDGAVPLRARDRRRREADEPDPRDRPRRPHRHRRARASTCSSSTRSCGRTAFIYPDDPASYPCSLVGGRIGTSGWSLIGARYGHTRDLVISFEIVLPTGEIIRVGDGGGRKIAQVVDAATSSSTCSWVTRARSGSSPRRRSSSSRARRPSSRPSSRITDYDDAWQLDGRRSPRSGIATLAGVVLFDERKVDYLRRDDEAYIPQPPEVKAVVAHGDVRQRGRGAGRRRSDCCGSAGDAAATTSATRSPRATGRRATTATRRRCTAGRADGQVVPMSWHCEDAAINYSRAAGGARGVARDRRPATSSAYDIFDDWGMFAYTNGALQAVGRLPHRDRHRHLGAAAGRRELGGLGRGASATSRAVALEHGGSITACHGSCREGEVDLVPIELGGGFEVMKTIKRALDPNNIMNPGKYLLDEAYEEDVSDARLPALATQRPPEAQRITDDRRHALRPRLRGRPRADDRAHAASRTCRPGTRSGSSTRRWEHLAWMHDHFADAVRLGRGAARGDRGRVRR